jgi:hypothetical protein
MGRPRREFRAANGEDRGVRRYVHCGNWGSEP